MDLEEGSRVSEGAEGAPRSIAEGPEAWAARKHPMPSGSKDIETLVP